MRHKSCFVPPSTDVITPTAIKALQQSSRHIPILADVVDVALAVQDKAQIVKTSRQKALLLSHRLFRTLETLADATQPDPHTLPLPLRESISSFKEFLTEIENAMSSLTKWKACLRLGSKRKEEVLDTFIRRLDQTRQVFVSRGSQADERSLGFQREGMQGPSQSLNSSTLLNHVEPTPDETLTQNESNMFEQSRTTRITGSNFYNVGRDARLKIIQSRNIPSMEENLSQIRRDISYGNALLYQLDIQFLCLQLLIVLF